MIEKSETLGELATALAKVQASLQPAKRNAENPYHKLNYADLAEVWNSCRAALAANGIAVVQFPSTNIEIGEVSVETMLTHTSGEYLSKAVSARPKDLLPQSVGSAITCLRRYGLAAAVGVVTEDDDGEAAQPREGGKAHNYPANGAKSPQRPAPAPANTAPFPSKEDLPDTSPKSLSPHETSLAQIKRLAWNLKLCANAGTWVVFCEALTGARPGNASFAQLDLGRVAIEKAESSELIKGWAGVTWKVSSDLQAKALGLIVAFRLDRTDEQLLNITGTSPQTKDAKSIQTMIANLESFLREESEAV